MLYDFKAAGQFQLDLSAGERVEILKQCQGWFRGRVIGRETKGIFPVSVIELGPDEPLPPPATPAAEIQRPAASPATAAATSALTTVPAGPHPLSSSATPAAAPAAASPVADRRPLEAGKGGAMAVESPSIEPISQQIQRIHSNDPKFIEANFLHMLSEEQMAALRAALTHNNHLQMLVLQRQAFRKASLLPLLASLEKIHTLTKLDLRSCELNDPCAAAVTESLRRLDSLCELDLRDNRFTRASGELLQWAIHAHRHLIAIWLDDGCTTTAQRTMIAACLRRNKLRLAAPPAESASTARVSEFDHSDVTMCLLEDWSAAELRELLATRLRQGDPITSLACLKSGVRECVDDLVALIQSQPTLSDLSIPHCTFRGEPLKQLMQYLCEDTHISKLDLGYSGLVDDDARCSVAIAHFASWTSE